MDYLQIDPRMDEHPDVEEAGFAATSVFQAVLRAIARNDGQGVLRSKYANPAWLARRMNLHADDIGGQRPESWVQRALKRCVDVGLLEPCDAGLHVPGWEKFYKPAKPGSVRTADWRRRQTGESATVTPVTPRDGRDETRHSVTTRDEETSQTSQPSPRDDTQHNSTPHHTTEKKKQPPSFAKDVLAVFEHYRATFKAKPWHPSEEQRALIEERLSEGHSVAELHKAIDGLAQSAWHQRKGHTRLRHAIGDAEAVRVAMGWADNPPDAEPKPQLPRIVSNAPPPERCAHCQGPGFYEHEGAFFCFEHRPQEGAAHVS